LIAAGLISLVLVLAFSSQIVFEERFLLPLDLEWSILALLVLQINLRSWCCFAEFILGSRSNLLGFVYLKSLALILLTALFVLGQARALLMFLIQLPLFLFLGCGLYWFRSRGEKPQAET